MEWLSQNWFWVVVGIGAIFMMSRGHRGGSGGCCGDIGHGKSGKPLETAELPPKDTVSGGAGHQH